MNGLELSQIFTWTPRTVDAFAAILVCTVAYNLYYFISISEGFRKKRIEAHGSEMGEARLVIAQRWLGGLLLGIPVVLAALLMPEGSFEAYGLGFSRPYLTLAYVGGLSTLIVIINLLIAGRPANLEQYPQIRVEKWSPGLLRDSSIGWIVYLLGYEAMFRGWLFFACLYLMGPMAAIAVNMAMYSLAHLIKGQAETFAAIPFGFIVCVITLHTGNMWTAFFVHIALALSNQYVALSKHPDMEVVR